ncbi:hypothetical protein [Alteribacillus sp. HJP-4]|uniref:hypothetical protein n=1 Tax=Alteribacillus sp. HJP-4 TaxID=2775394 RepID=UPI0035CCE6BA
MNKWMAVILTAAALLVFPANTFASVNAWQDAEPMFITVVTIISVLTLIGFVYLMIRDNG